jgi:hypothetical protein
MLAQKQLSHDNPGQASETENDYLQRGRASERLIMKKSILARCVAPWITLANLPLAAMAGSDQPPAKKPSTPPVENARVQPRGQEFMPNSSEDDAIQRRLSIFNQQQGLEDVALDKKLKICRGC